jgi:hypothetical protein
MTYHRTPRDQKTSAEVAKRYQLGRQDAIVAAIAVMLVVIWLFVGGSGG